MFTGIVTSVGEVASKEQRGDTRFWITAGTDAVSEMLYDPNTIAQGASIACAGCCLTVIDTRYTKAGSGAFLVEASAETMDKTTLKSWQVGTQLNLERAAKLGDELGGHLVSGHVDGVALITGITSEGDSKRFHFRLPEALSAFVAVKGSITLDGTSLTVNEVEGCEFGVNIIPHTLKVTNWGQAAVGDSVNVEIDMLARYVARLLQVKAL